MPEYKAEYQINDPHSDFPSYKSKTLKFSAASQKDALQIAVLQKRQFAQQGEVTLDSLVEIIQIL